MTKVVMFMRGGLFPVDMGSRRYMTGLAEYLNSLSDIELTIVCMEEKRHRNDEAKYLKIAKRIEWIDPPRRFGIFDLLNKVVSRMGIDVFGYVFTSLAVRRKFLKLCKDADKIVINYTVWFALLPRSIRRDKCVVITHDLLYYRKASFGGTGTVWKRIWIAVNRMFELRILCSYARIGVLGDYESSELVKYGVSRDRIIHTGFPMTVTYRSRTGLKKYDFVFVGSGRVVASVAALEMFFDRVAKLLPDRTLSVAVTQGDSWNWNCISVPANVKLIKLGFVDDLAELLSEVRIGIGTIPIGSGVKTKVVEMMMNNMLVVATHHALEGVPALRGSYINMDCEDENVTKNWIVQALGEDLKLNEFALQNGAHLREEFGPEKCLREIVSWLRNRSIT